MSTRKFRRQRITVVNPGPAFQPEDLLRFVHLPPFERDRKNLGLEDEDLIRLQVKIMIDPRGCPIIKGTGGLRKLRFAPSRWKTGKSGPVLLVGYVFLEEYGTVLLAIAYGKSVQDDLSHDEKKTISQLIKRIELEFSSGIIK